MTRMVVQWLLALTVSAVAMGVVLAHAARAGEVRSVAEAAAGVDGGTAPRP